MPRRSLSGPKAPIRVLVSWERSSCSFSEWMRTPGGRRRLHTFASEWNVVPPYVVHCIIRSNIIYERNVG